MNKPEIEIEEVEQDEEAEEQEEQTCCLCGVYEECDCYCHRATRRF